VLRNEKNLGIAEAEQGPLGGEGKYIMWQDAETFDVLPDARAIELLERNPDVGIVGGALRFFDATGEHRERHY